MALETKCKIVLHYFI